MKTNDYLEQILPSVNKAILDNDYTKFNSFFAADTEEDGLDSNFAEISNLHIKELGKLISFTKITEEEVSRTECRLTLEGVFEKDTATIMVLLRQAEGSLQLLEHTYTWN